MQEPARQADIPEIILPAALLACIVAALQLALLAPGCHGEHNSMTVIEVIVLGFLPWLYFAFVAGRMFKVAVGKCGLTKAEFLFAEAVCLAAAIAAEMLISWCVVYWSGMLKPAPFPREIVVLAFLVPFALGIPACFTFAIRLSKLLGAPARGLMPGLLISVGLLHPFTLLGAQVSMIVLVLGPNVLQSYSASFAWILSAAAGYLISMVGLSKLSAILKTKLLSVPVSAQTALPDNLGTICGALARDL